MNECDSLSGCPFFNDKMGNKPALSEMYKKNFCKGDFVNCARHIVKEALGKQFVPPDLFPNQHERAKELIKK